MKTVYIILAFCLGLFVGHLLFPNQKELKPPLAETLVRANGKVNMVDSVKATVETELRAQNAILKIKLKTMENLLSENKSKLLVERNKLSLLYQRLNTDTSICKDSLFRDSLSTQFAILNEATDSLMSVYENKMDLTENLVAIRDSEIVICNRSYSQLKDFLDEQARREQKLTEDLNTLLKQQKKKRLQNRLLAGGMLFISGIATTLFIKSRE